MKQYELFTKQTQAIVFGLQKNAIQSMFDFDFMCERKKPSVAAIIQPSQIEEKSNFKIFWGSNEILIPVYRQLEFAIDKHPEADVFINFASFRSAYDTTLQALESESLRTIVIIAEGIPERQTRELIKVAKQKERILIGPATVGGVKAGAFKIGNAAGTVENIRLSKLYRPGCVGFVSKSGGMSNEMYFLISQCTNGIYEGIAIGGDRYPGSQLIDHVLRFEANPDIKMIVCLGELGGLEEYAIADAVREGIVKKPVIMWVAGDSMKILPKGTQFGHAGAMANSEKEKAESKNRALSEAGVIVPESFDDIGEKIGETYEELKKQGLIPDIEETEPPKIPMDFDRALRMGMVRRQSDIASSISDDRGAILTYNGKQIDDIIQTGKSLGYIIGLLWFKKELTVYAQNYIELVLKLTADHGPAVSGAHNAIVSARAGKDLVSSLASGILTIGPRFGGAISDSAKYFGYAYDNDLSPKQFIDYMKSDMRMNIPGIGHRVKSVQNPDVRVTLLKKFVEDLFPSHSYLDYALEVEKLTTTKRSNLILNVDGCIGVTFLDLMKNLGFSKSERDEIIETEMLNGLFVLGRSIGIIGHIIDQKRQRAGLYRQPYDEILYLDE